MNCGLIEWLRQHSTFNHLFNLIKKSKKKKTAWNWTIIYYVAQKIYVKSRKGIFRLVRDNNRGINR